MSGGQIFRNGKRGRGLRRPLCHRQLAVQSLRVGVDLGIRVGVQQRLLGGVAGATFLFYEGGVAAAAAMITMKITMKNMEGRFFLRHFAAVTLRR